MTTAVELGSPKSKIIDTAAEWHADLIVLGSHGRTGLDRFLLGSLPDSVLRHAHCSVELVRLPRPAEGSKRISRSSERQSQQNTARDRRFQIFRGSGAAID